MGHIRENIKSMTAGERHGHRDGPPSTCRMSLGDEPGPVKGRSVVLQPRIIMRAKFL